MVNDGKQQAAQTADKEWISFPGGEFEGKRPRLKCPACRKQPTRAPTLCFQCYRAELERERAIAAAGQLDTSSDARFQYGLPFEPVNTPRLEMLRAERMAARSIRGTGAGRFVDKRRLAQIAARHALQRVATGLQARQVRSALPASWLPFVASK